MAILAIKIIPYEAKHQPFFERLNRDWIEKYFWMEPIDFAVLQNPEQEIIRAGGFIWMAIKDDTVVGTVALKYAQPGVYELTKMAVDEKYRGLKIGRSLAAVAIEKASQLGAAKVVLDSNTILEAAIQLYKSLGFSAIPTDGLYKRSNIKMELLLGKIIGKPQPA